VAHAVGNRQFTFSLLVHSDAASPMVDWSQSSSILQVCVVLTQGSSARSRVSVRDVAAAPALTSLCAATDKQQQVRSDCPPRQLVEFLLSDSGVQADQVSGLGAAVWGRQRVCARHLSLSQQPVPDARASLQPACLVPPPVRHDRLPLLCR
jgi:hypothetical protein